MKYAPAAALTLLAAVIAVIGGVLQNASGAGSQPGITLTHIGGAAAICALIAAFAGSHAEPDPKPVYVTATDGHAVIPVIGPYTTERAAYHDLGNIRAQFDPEGRYAWTVQTAAHETTVAGAANEFFKVT
ncbi:hypothetical protein MTY66_62700 (plasmid) [Mycolicibacterium sp. TY66]|uniref:hypothetical protein n=1 Tax=unclassified Mycolicibacterium TaxID=2636767 RepID=UPI001BB45F91|nr:MULTISPECIES: hypothetical protein [unclassified Mycolicibacterium]BCI84645.1 hypothetical protein MTY66_62700 [Mycolicibacterium sp. TY66]BCJ84875.1 hypothetical protein MTY81_62480 [Mycolicibacterium sp. TY81]